MIAELSELPVHSPSYEVEGSFISDPIEDLAALFPALAEAARIYIERYSLEGRLEVEDLVHEAIARRFKAAAAGKVRSEDRPAMFIWLFKTMKHIAVDVVRSQDALDDEHESLEE